MCDLDADSPRAWHSRWRRARKTHRCVACSEAIEPGHVYRYSSGVWDEPAAFKHCARCWAMFEALNRRTVDSIDVGLACGSSWEEAFGEDPPPEIAALAFMTADEAQGLAS